jgi:hypothetical protein
VTGLSGTNLTWRGLTIGGTRLSRHWMSSLEGWEDLPGTRHDSMARPSGHGAFGAPVWSDERVVVVTGGCSTPAERDDLLRELQSVMTLTGSALPEDLTIEHAGRTLTAGATLTRFRPSMAYWSSGHFGWAAEWVCSDPLRYGDPLALSTGFAVAQGGLEYDLYTDGAGTDLGWLDYGEASATGRVALYNPGTADVPVTIQVDGPIPGEGFDVIQVGAGRRLTFTGPVAVGSSLVLDGATGAVVIDGTADRAGQLTWRDWPIVPAGGSIELLFSPRGSRSEAVMTAVMRPGWW